MRQYQAGTFNFLTSIRNNIDIQSASLILVYTALAHLVSRGFRRIGYVGSHSDVRVMYVLTFSSPLLPLSLCVCPQLTPLLFSRYGAACFCLAVTVSYFVDEALDKQDAL